MHQDHDHKSHNRKDPFATRNVHVRDATIENRRRAARIIIIIACALELNLRLSLSLSLSLRSSTTKRPIRHWLVLSHVRAGTTSSSYNRAVLYVFRPLERPATILVTYGTHVLTDPFSLSTATTPHCIIPLTQ